MNIGLIASEQTEQITNTKTESDLSSPAPYSLVPDPSRAKPELADIVVSLNGRDQGKYFLVVGIQEDYSLLADGKGRRVEKPKLKKNKHLRLEDKADCRIMAKLEEGEKVTNNEIRRALAQYAASRDLGGGM